MRDRLLILRFTGKDCRYMTWIVMQAFIREIGWLRRWERGEGASVGEKLAEMMADRAAEE